MPRRAKRAAAGSWDVIQRVNQVTKEMKAEGATYKEAAQLLGISRRSLYNYRMVYQKKMAGRTILARPSTVDRWRDRLQSAAVTVISEQTRAVSEGRKPSRTSKQAAKLMSAATGKKHTYQGVSAITRGWKPEKVEREVVPPIGWYPLEDEPPIYYRPPLTSSDLEKFTRADYDAGLTRHYVNADGVRFMKEGETWVSEDGTPNGLIEQRSDFMTHEEAEDYITEITNSKYVLVVVIKMDEYGEEYYTVYLDVDS